MDGVRRFVEFYVNDFLVLCVQSTSHPVLWILFHALHYAQLSDASERKSATAGTCLVFDTRRPTQTTNPWPSCGLPLYFLWTADDVSVVIGTKVYNKCRLRSMLSDVKIIKDGWNQGHSLLLMLRQRRSYLVPNFKNVLYTDHMQMEKAVPPSGGSSFN